MSRVKQLGVKEIGRCFGPIVGKRPWRARLGWGSFLTFEFGPKIKVKGHLHGIWHLWIYMCEWDLVVNRQVLNSEDPRTKINRFVRLLEHKPLTDVTVDSAITAFHFGQHAKLVCRPPSDGNFGPDSPYWMLFMPEDKVLEYGPGVRAKIVPSGEPVPSAAATS